MQIVIDTDIENREGLLLAAALLNALVEQRYRDAAPATLAIEGASTESATAAPKRGRKPKADAPGATAASTGEPAATPPATTPDASASLNPAVAATMPVLMGKPATPADKGIGAPTEPPAAPATEEEVKTALGFVYTKYGKTLALQVLQRFGATRVSGLKSEQYGAVKRMADAALAAGDV